MLRGCHAQLTTGSTKRIGGAIFLSLLMVICSEPLRKGLFYQPNLQIADMEGFLIGNAAVSAVSAVSTDASPPTEVDAIFHIHGPEIG